MREAGPARVYCVLGHPIKHSLSPAMQNAALAQMGIHGVYVAFDVLPDGLADAVRGLRALGIAGANCTIPHKEALLGLVDALDPEAEVMGAVNTLVFVGEGDERRIIGHNTDGRGFLRALADEDVDPRGRRVLVLGAGGSARAVVTALVRAGAEVTLCNRTAARAAALADAIWARLRLRVRVVDDSTDSLERAALAAEIVVNTTSVGMQRAADPLPASPIPPHCLHSGMFVYDLVYNPWETPLLRDARARGVRAANGAGMLAHQGALSLELWTGQSAPVTTMLHLLRRSLGGEPA